MKKSFFINMFKGNEPLIRALKMLERKGLYEIRVGSTYTNLKLLQLTHFYKRYIIFKVLAASYNTLWEPKSYLKISYTRLPGLKIKKVTQREVPLYIGDATPFLADYLRKEL